MINKIKCAYPKLFQVRFCLGPNWSDLKTSPAFIGSSKSKIFKNKPGSVWFRSSQVLPHWSSCWQSKKTQALWWRGLPPPVRGRVWKLALQNQVNTTGYEGGYDQGCGSGFRVFIFGSLAHTVFWVSDPTYCRSLFINIVDPDPYSEYGSGSTQLKKTDWQKFTVLLRTSLHAIIFV